MMMSGGVDSSVAAGMLVEQGHEVAGITLKLWGGESDSGCCSIADVDDAQRVAAQIGIPHYVFNLTDEFDANVVQPYVDAYQAGETPNPCVECNRTIKWGPALERVRQLGFDAMATGHHAQIVETPEGRVIARSPDMAKDQSYVLAVLTADQLSSTILPLGDVTKEVVRAKAREWGLRTATKSDSQDVCFNTKGNRVAFLGARIPLHPGPIQDREGAVLGEHEGIASVTIGQRRGLSVAAGQRQYVVDINAETNTVTLGSQADLLVERVQTTPWQWTNGAPAAEEEVGLQVRAHGATIPAHVTEDGATFLSPAQRVAAGQLIVAYRGDQVLGSAIALG